MLTVSQASPVGGGRREPPRARTAPAGEVGRTRRPPVPRPNGPPVAAPRSVPRPPVAARTGCRERLPGRSHSRRPRTAPAAVMASGNSLSVWMTPHRTPRRSRYGQGSGSGIASRNTIDTRRPRPETHVLLGVNHTSPRERTRARDLPRVARPADQPEGHHGPGIRHGHCRRGRIGQPAFGLPGLVRSIARFGFSSHEPLEEESARCSYAQGYPCVAASCRLLSRGSCELKPNGAMERPRREIRRRL